jgi:glycosyltransferase involved in cell wall biosynthesis
LPEKKIKNILYVVSSFPRPSETFISDEVASLFLFGIKPHLLSLNLGDEDVVHASAKHLIDNDCVTYVSSISRISIIYAIFKLLFKRPFRVFRSLKKAYGSKYRWLYFQAAPYAHDCLQKKTNFIHAHFADVNFIFASMISEWSGVPYGVTTHRYDLLKDPIPVDLATNCFKQAALVVTISESNRNFMTEKFGLASEDIKVIHCGVDLGKFKYVNSQNRFKNHCLRFINVGRLVPEKAQDILLHAFCEAHKKGVSFHLTIVGDGPLRHQLEDLCKTLCIDDFVEFVGAKTQDVVVQLLQDADVFVLSSRNEGLPVVCMEAMATGPLLIATRINGIPELVRNLENGLLVESEDINGLADTICWVHKNRAALGEMSFLARKSIELDFDRKKCTQLLIDKIRTILN